MRRKLKGEKNAGSFPLVPRNQNFIASSVAVDEPCEETRCIVFFRRREWKRLEYFVALEKENNKVSDLHY